MRPTLVSSFTCLHSYWNEMPVGWSKNHLIHRYFFSFSFYPQTSVANHDGLPIEVSLCSLCKSWQTWTCVSSLRTSFSLHLAAPQYQNHIYNTAQRHQWGCKRGPIFCCDAYMQFHARQGYLCLLSTAECLYHLFQLAAGDSDKSQEIFFQNPVTLLRHASEFACSDSQDNIINILLSLFFFLAASLHLNVISLAEQHPHLWPAYLSAAPLNLTCASRDLHWNKAKFPHIQP